MFSFLTVFLTDMISPFVSAPSVISTILFFVLDWRLIKMFDEFKNKLLSNKIIKTRDYVLCKKNVDEKMAVFEEYNYKYW